MEFKRSFFIKTMHFKWLLIAGIMALTSCKTSPRIGYVTLSTIYDSFPLKKQYEDSLHRVEKARNAILDSLYKNISKTESVKDADTLKEIFLRKREQFLSENKLVVQHYNDEIWKRINSDIKSFGDKNKYDFILGANGTGLLMYADSTKNITREVVHYMKGSKLK